MASAVAVADKRPITADKPLSADLATGRSAADRMAAGPQATAQAATPGQSASDPEHGQGARDRLAGEVGTDEAVREAFISVGEGHYGATAGLCEGGGAEAEASTHVGIKALEDEGIETGRISRAGGGEYVRAGVQYLLLH